MANPNIINVSSIYGNTAVANISTTATALINNADSSGVVYKVNGIIVSNIDSSNSASITVDLYRNNVPYKLINNLTLTINTSYTPIDKTLSMYLREGDSIRLTASANNRLQAIATWEEIS